MPPDPLGIWGVSAPSVPVRREPQGTMSHATEPGGGRAGQGRPLGEGMPWLGLKCPGKKLGRKFQEAAGLRQGAQGPHGASGPLLPCLLACDSEPRADKTPLCLTGWFGVSLGQPHSPSNRLSPPAEPPPGVSPMWRWGPCAHHPLSAQQGFENSGIGTMGLPTPAARPISGESGGDGLQREEEMLGASPVQPPGS